MTVPTQAKASGMSYSATVLILMILSMIASLIIGAAGVTFQKGAPKPDWYVYLNYLLPQISLCLVAVLYFAWLKRPIRQAIQEQKCHPKYYLVAIILQIGLLALGNLNEIFLGFLERFGYKPSSVILPNLDGFGIVATIFCVAVLPAIFEEILFRGILLKGLRSFGTVGGILLCGALFSLYHQSPVQTVYQFACGVAFAFVAMRSGSILPTVLSHFINNALIIILTRCGVNGVPAAAYVPYLAVTSLCLVGSLAYLFFFDTPKTEKEEKKPLKTDLRKEREETKAERLRFFAFAAAGIAVLLVNWLTALTTGM